jgi:hypothetical protein
LNSQNLALNSLGSDGRPKNANQNGVDGPGTPHSLGSNDRDARRHTLAGYDFATGSKRLSDITV